MASNLPNEINEDEITKYSLQLDKTESEKRTKFRKGKWALAFKIDPKPKKAWYDYLETITKNHQLQYSWEKGKNERDSGHIIFYTDYAGNRDKMVEKLKNFKKECEEMLFRTIEVFRNEKIEDLKNEKARKQKEKEQREIFSDVLKQIDT